MSSISYIWNEKKIEVITLSFFTCGGEQLAVVQALSGKPFSSMGRWTIATPFMTVKVADLIIDDECTCTIDGDACPACVESNRTRYPGDEFPYSEASK